MNRFCCISINHRHAPVSLRERIHLEPASALPLLKGDAEALTLNTCNRTEIYGCHLRPSEMLALITSVCQIQDTNLEGLCEIFEARDAIAHLFAVCSGLDSLVLGEPQILGQAKEAFAAAVRAGTTATLLNKAMHRAFRTAKRVRNETEIGRYPVSVASEAVELAGHVFGDIQRSAVLVIGAGDMACIAARRLKDRGVRTLTIINRTHTAACSLARDLGGKAGTFDNLETELMRSDIVITSTGAPTPLIGRPLMERIMKARRHSPLIIIDIALPRDVDPEVGRLYNCYLYDIDALKDIVERHACHRELQLDQASAILESEVDAFEAWLSALTAQETIKDLYALLERYIGEELRSEHIGEEDQGHLAQAVHRVLKRFIHRPVSFLKAHPSLANIENARRLFQLDEDYQDRHKGQPPRPCADRDSEKAS